jgi:pyruvate dehydrogenase E1 component beta subunit
MIDYLDAPIRRLGAPFVPIPFSPALEKLVKINAADVVRVAREICP